MKKFKAHILIVDDGSPDGTGDFVIQAPTFFANNEQSSYIELPVLDKKLIRTIDLLGRVGLVEHGVCIYIYDDGSVEKKFLINSTILALTQE